MAKKLYIFENLKMSLFGQKTVIEIIHFESLISI